MIRLAARYVVRRLRDELIPLQRLRLANPEAVISSSVVFLGDPARTRLHREVFVARFTTLAVTDGGGLTGASLEIGERTYLGEYNSIRSAGAPIRIGRECLISQYVSIVGSNHQTSPGTPIVDQRWVGTGVSVGDDVWIGAGACLMPGVSVGDGAVIGANSVVLDDVEPGAIVVGTPARQVGVRD